MYDDPNLFLGDILGIGPDRKVEGTPYSIESVPAGRISDHLMQFNAMDSGNGGILHSPPETSVELRRDLIRPQVPGMGLHDEYPPAEHAAEFVEQLIQIDPKLKFDVSIKESADAVNTIGEPQHRVIYKAEADIYPRQETQVNLPNSTHRYRDFRDETLDPEPYKLILRQNLSRTDGTMADGERAMNAIIGKAPEVEARYSIDIDSNEELCTLMSKLDGRYDLYLFEPELFGVPEDRSELIEQGIPAQNATSLFNEYGIPEEESLSAEFTADSEGYIRFYGVRGPIEEAYPPVQSPEASLVPQERRLGVNPELQRYLEEISEVWLSNIAVANRQYKDNSENLKNPNIVSHNS